MTACPRCGEGVAAGQEYCLECGLRLPGVVRFEAVPASPRRLALPLLLAALVAAGGAVAAIALTRETATATPVFTATGGSQVVPTATVATALATWPAGKSGWTNVLISVPKVDGRDAAVARAEQARRRGLRDVGVLDSSRYPSLHPGYWVVYSGVYPSEPEAASRLREAKGVQRGARSARISP